MNGLSPPDPSIDSLQTIFDYALLKIFEQGAVTPPSATAACSYRSGELRCTIGIFLKNYNPSYEQYVVDELIEQGIFGKISDDMNALLCDLQFVHDSIAMQHNGINLSPDEFRKEFLQAMLIIGIRHRLRTYQIEELQERIT